MKTTWWLDHSALPDLLWARLRVHPSGTADVLDLDGKLHTFLSEEEAVHWLSEDEYARLEYLLEEGEVAPTLQPPHAIREEALVPLMRVLRQHA